MPFVIILLLSVSILWLASSKKSPKIFLIGILTSFFISYSLYQINILSEIASINDSNEIIVKAMERNRGLIVVEGLLKGTFIITAYHILLGYILWFLYYPKNNVNRLSLKEYVKTNEFYIILLAGCIIDILLGRLRNISFFLWEPFYLCIFIFPFLSIKALQINIFNKILWLEISLFIALILF